MSWLSGTLLWEVVGGVLLVSGVLMGLWVLLRDRSRGKLRCPKCWYLMEGTPAQSLELLASKRQSLRCPECGKVISSVRQLRKTRKRWWLMLPAVMFVVLAPQAFDQPQRIAGGETWSRAVPTWLACCFLVSDDVNTRTDAKMLLTMREPRCNSLDKWWMYKWRDAGLPLDLKDLLEHRKEVVAGMPFGVDGHLNMSWAVNSPRFTVLRPNVRILRNSSTPMMPAAGFVSRVFSTPVTISETIHPNEWKVVPENDAAACASRVWASYIKFRAIAPVDTGKRRVYVPMESIVGNEVIRLQVPIELEVFADVNAVLTPVDDKVFESQVAQWMRLQLTDDGGANVWYLGAERDFTFALKCEVIFEGKVVGTMTRPLLPYDHRSVEVQLSKEIHQRLLRVQRKLEPAHGWVLRVHGSPEAIHELTSLNEYWNGSVEIPIADVLEE